MMRHERRGRSLKEISCSPGDGEQRRSRESGGSEWGEREGDYIRWVLVAKLVWI
jgi:hypothetical protein